MSESPPQIRPREALAAFLIAVIFSITLKAGLDQIVWKFAGPITLVVTLALTTPYLHWRGEGWRALGLRRPDGWKSILLVGPQTLLGIVAILGTGVGVTAAGETLGLWSTDLPSEGIEARWGDIEGNLQVYLLWLALGWISGGLFEELFFRAFMISRLQKAFSGLPAGLATGLAILLPALVFGYGHFYYQGLRGLFVTGMIGVVLGVLYLVYKRNLWPLILAHALVDSLAFTAMYLDLDI